MGQDFAAFFAPFALLIGAALLAIGLLSLLGAHFLANVWRERVALALGLALLVAAEIAIAFSGLSLRFFNGQRADVLQCRQEAETNFPAERHKDSPIINDNIIACMQRYRYDWTSDHRRCRESPVATNPFCYLPARPFDRWLTRLQIMLE
ncbi:hypothetical protein LG047_18090 [Methylocystis sp. WRRC1]|uniref:hypothetical protein n=1 Tax=Methylocystis sp. WRRC1 TaxID=1732014 RepID=UPI001D15259B|nr:hypothetical protein [Methylocystis sp. WRRC1]MCC3247203.1 hypothetical protein [Methylocystis sp. WRRC1]